jgi:uncharacterized glyoxalase superfamily protein PhnB/uncharacterized protein YndB with AHSA1/START domain
MSNLTTASRVLRIVREFNAPKDIVFDAFSSAEALAEWWGPVGFSIKVNSFEFRVNGVFHYKMEADGMKMWGRFVYKKIERPDIIEFISSFSDETGAVQRAPFPQLIPLEIFNSLSFEQVEDKTILRLTAYPVNADEKEQMAFNDLESSMQKGYGGTFTKLDRYLKAQSELKNQLNRNTMARTSTYLNFPGNTEEAFGFYKSIFKTEFNGGGIRRFGDLPASADQPPLSEADKKLVLHVELPITGGHVLMATDAAESMGFKVNPGNNMHISIEPGSREETERIFKGLSTGGNITMPLQDMFWGAYYGSLTDKYGINWMVNFPKQ